MKTRLNKFVAYILLPISFAIVAIFSLEAILGAGFGLDNGAHLFMYGFVGLIIGLILASIAIRKLSNKNLGLLNLICFVGINLYIYRVYQKDMKKDMSKMALSQENQSLQKPVKTGGIPDPDFQMEVKLDKGIGIGMSRAVLNVTNTIELLNNPGGKAKDRISFKMGSTGLEYNEKPKLLNPEYDKLDYNILYFKTIAQEGAFLEVIVDKESKKTMWLSKQDVRFLPWSEFFFTVHSIEPSDWHSNPLRIKPDANSAPIAGVSQGNILKAVIVQSYWVKVEIYDDNYKLTGTGWFQWRDDKQILISYNLLS